MHKEADTDVPEGQLSFQDLAVERLFWDWVMAELRAITGSPEEDWSPLMTSLSKKAEKVAATVGVEWRGPV